MDDKDDKNVFKMISGGKDITPKVAAEPTVAPEETIPMNPYEIITINDERLYAEGFLLFTSQHIAVMRDNGSGALPVLVVPLNMVKYAELCEVDDESELPF